VICLCELQLHGTAEVTVGSAKLPRLRVRPRSQGWALVIFTEPSVNVTANRSESLCGNKQLQDTSVSFNALLKDAVALLLVG
jgi:hypothetical protein